MDNAVKSRVEGAVERLGDLEPEPFVPRVRVRAVVRRGPVAGRDHLAHIERSEPVAG